MSKACDSQQSPSWSAALIPPWAAFECERTGWTLRDDPDRHALLGRRQRRALPGEAGADHQYVVLGHSSARSYIDGTQSPTAKRWLVVA